ncbi:MAG TPA: DinB family protein [Gemmatimonadaceae bacterium]|nr:DinB family protein [Gemmatimonadaceae bacterium]
MRHPLPAIAAMTLALASNLDAQVAPKGRGFRAEYLAELSVAEDHVIRLAEKIPADKYIWRPAAGVRSVSEVLLHIASSQNNLPAVLGVAPRESMFGADYDKSTTDKTTVVTALKSAFAATRAGLDKLTDADSEKTLPFFDGTTTYRGVLYFMARHTGEHTGQLIAYARMIGVVPPWNER